MHTMPVSSRPHSAVARHRAPPLTGVMVGTAVSLLLWAFILAVVFVVR